MSRRAQVPAGRLRDLPGFRREVDDLLADLDLLTTGLSPEQLTWRPEGRWSLADNFSHLVVTGRWYLKHIDRALDSLHAQGRRGDGHAALGLLERLIVHIVEPPVRRLRVRAPRGFEAATDVAAHAALDELRALQHALQARLARAEGHDLRAAQVRTPMSRRIRVSLAAGFAMMLAHERRHLWQAFDVRNRADFPGAPIASGRS
jgi:hypothetical protein